MNKWYGVILLVLEMRNSERFLDRQTLIVLFYPNSIRKTPKILRITKEPLPVEKYFYPFHYFSKCHF